MPLKFWSEAFLTAAYLINRLPTRVIDNTCPLERLFHQSPNYSMLRVFGCACWPHLRPYRKQKLSFRSKQCVFIGYSSLHKGYKCLDPESGRVYICREVIFDEHVFPFAQHSSLANSSSDPQPSSLLRTLHLNDGSSNVQHDLMQFPPVCANHLDTETPEHPVPATTSGSSPLPAAVAPVPTVSSTNDEPIVNLGTLCCPRLMLLHPISAVPWC
jgi:histone deacetylase 1/2